MEIFNLFTPNECKKIIDLTKNIQLEDSKVSYDHQNDNVYNNNSRKSKQAFIKDAHDPIFTKFAQLSEQITGIPIKNQEDTQVVVYQPGGHFVEHYDSFCGEANNKAECDKLNHYAGDRRSTLIVYLNDNYTGGETEFVELGLKIKPEVGKGVLFWSTDENGNLFRKSKHKANVLIAGEKWIATKWSHPKEFN